MLYEPLEKLSLGCFQFEEEEIGSSVINHQIQVIFYLKQLLKQCFHSKQGLKQQWTLLHTEVKKITHVHTNEDNKTRLYSKAKIINYDGERIFWGWFGKYNP